MEREREGMSAGGRGSGGAGGRVSVGEREGESWALEGAVGYEKRGGGGTGVRSAISEVA